MQNLTSLIAAHRYISIRKGPRTKFAESVEKLHGRIEGILSGAVKQFLTESYGHGSSMYESFTWLPGITPKSMIDGDRDSVLGETALVRKCSIGRSFWNEEL